MPTSIISNGSKTAGEAPDSIERLLEVLARHPLDGSFAPFVHESLVTRSHRFFGNFRTLSHVFNIDTTDPDLIAKLTDAIHADQQRPDYEVVLSGEAFAASRREEREETGSGVEDAGLPLQPKLL